MWKKIAIGVGIVVLAFVAVVITRPSEFKIERSLAMNAPADVVFPLINNFHAWSTWSPWEKLDPDMQREFKGSEQGAGAVYSWTGNEEVGRGQMTIVDSQPSKVIDIKLEFFEPWEATNPTLFTLTPSGEGTQVTWTMTGKNNFVGKAMSLFMDMDAMVGKDFEKGLEQMKQKAEANAGERAAKAKREAVTKESSRGDAGAPKPAATETP